MKNLLFVLASLCSYGTYAQGVVVPDTLTGVNWEQLPNVPTRFQLDQLTGRGERLALRSGGDLYLSVDNGDSWHLHSHVGDMDITTVTNTQVFGKRTTREDYLNGQGELHTTTLFQGATTSGTALAKDTSYNQITYYGVPSGGATSIEVYGPHALNDNTLFTFSRRSYYGNTTSAELKRSTDGGLSWQADTTFNYTGRVSGSADTVVFFRREYSAPPVLQLFAGGGLTLLRADTVLTHNQARFFIQLVYRDGIYYGLTQNNSVFPTTSILHTSSDYGATWQVDTLVHAIRFEEHYIRTQHIQHDSVYLATYSATPTFYYPAYPSETGRLFYQENDLFYHASDGLFRSTDGGMNWTSLAVPFVGQAAAILVAQERIFISTVNDITGASEHYRSSPIGLSFLPYSSNLPNQAYSYFGHTDAALYAEAAGTAYRSIDAGTTWLPVAIPTPGSYHTYYNFGDQLGWVGSAFGIYDELADTTYNFPVSFGRSMASIGDTLFAIRATSNDPTHVLPGYLSVDGGQTFEQLGYFNWGIPRRAARLYASGSNFWAYHPSSGFHRSTDYGSNWLRVQPDTLPIYYTDGFGQSKRHQIFGPFADDLVLAHADGGVWLTRDYGQTWTVLSDVPFTTRFPLGVATRAAAQYFLHDGYLNAVSTTGERWRASLIELLQGIASADFNYQRISGRLYQDVNGDCSYQPGTDQPLEGRSIQIGDDYAVAGLEGRYEKYVRPGSYELQVAPRLYHEFACDTNVRTVLIDSLDAEDIDFVHNPTAGNADLNVTLFTATPFRPGFSGTLYVSVRNVGTEPATNRSLVLEYPVAAMIVSHPQATGVPGSLTLDVSLSVGEHATYVYDFTIDAGIPLGDTLTLWSRIDWPTDVRPQDNASGIVRAVQGSFDPNDKTAYPSDNYVLPQTSNELDYRIRFQNTGTDTAFRVTVVDTLAADYDLLTLRTLSASHPYTFDLRAPGIATWTFDDILLPDSTTNEPASHGFIFLRVNTLGDVTLGDTLRNSAAIYFDYNEPVITNTATNAIEKGELLNTQTVQLCAGDNYEGTVYQQSATLLDTLIGAQVDTVVRTEILVAPTYDLQRDTAIAVGSTYAGTLILGDTSFVQSLTTAAGCDSTVTTNVSVFVNTDTPALPGLQLALSPNPSDGPVRLRVTADRRAHLRLELYDATGRRVNHTLPPLDIAAGAATHVLPLTGLAPGSYWLHVRTDTGTATLPLYRQ